MSTNGPPPALVVLVRTAPNETAAVAGAVHLYQTDPVGRPASGGLSKGLSRFCGGAEKVDFHCSFGAFKHPRVGEPVVGGGSRLERFGSRGL